MGRVNKKRSIGFKSKKQREKFDKHLKTLHCRWAKSTIDIDHLYTTRVDLAFVSDNTLHVADNVVVVDLKRTSRFDNDWGKGRRVVELGVLAEGLCACQKCGQPLQLSHATDITTHELGAVIKVHCSNTVCHHTNNIATGKRHNRIWDANTKLAEAMIHAGLGGNQLNNLFAGLNIPPVSNHLLNDRLKDASHTMEKVAETTMKDCILEESRLTREHEGITASVEAGWQKRGSGWSYDSLSARTAHITQVAAVSGERRFNTYVMPKLEITTGAAAITGLTRLHGRLFLRGQPVEAVTISSAIDDLIAFISQQSPPVILAGHKRKN